MLNAHDRFDDGALIADRFRIVEPISEGGMGAVYRAFDEEAGRRVALKLCLPELPPEDRRRFAREVRAMRSISSPHVMPVLHADLDGEFAFFVMPEATCRLDERFATFGQKVDAALAAFDEICEGVSAVHAAGQIHRDIKPKNVLLLQERWVVSDLGLVVFSERDTTALTRSHDLVGTLAYIAPEVSDGAEATKVSDVYALGLVLYQMVTGSTSTLVDDGRVPFALRATLRRATERVPARRMQSVDELQNEVRAVRATLRPEFDPAGRFRAAMSSESRLSANEWAAAIIYYTQTEDDASALKLFDEIHVSQLKHLGAENPQAALAMLARYSDALRASVKDRGFEYAETVARRMSIVVKSTTDAHVATEAMRCTLIAAVGLWRFRALDAFDAMLEEITDVRLAEHVAAMLLDERDFAAHALLRHSNLTLPPALRAVRAMLEQRKQDT